MIKKVSVRIVSAFMAASLLLQTPVTANLFTNDIYIVEAATTKYGTIKQAVNLRKSASNSAKVLKVLSKGTVVAFLNTSAVGWYRVKVGSTIGYVGKNYVTVISGSTSTTAASGTGTVTAAYLNMRKSASNTATVVKVLTNGTKVTIKGTTGSWYKVTVNGTTGYVSKSYIKTSSSSSSSSSSTSSTSAKVTSSSTSSSSAAKGQQIVNYALKFVGNPYVWGGTSLTKGADCSGFTMSVYKHFGYTIPRTSALQRSAGTAVSSLSKAQAGDLICYSGHVAIYMGNNKIVHAANSRRGIVSGDAATYTTILAIRRIVK